MNKYIDLEERNRIADDFHRRQGPLLPATIDEAVDGKISYADLEKGLTVRFPFVEGMRVGAPYYLSLGSGGISFALFGQIQEENQDTVVLVPAEKAMTFQGLEISLGYRYFEFEESAAPSTHYSVEGRIYKPIVDEAVDGVIPLEVLSQGVNLRIRSASSLSPGALVSVYWWGTHADGCFVKHLTVGPEPAEDLLVPVEPACLMPHKGGHVRVIYTVLSATGTETSLLLDLAVANDLAAPWAVYAVSGDNREAASVLPITEDGGVPMLFSTRGMVAGDVAILMFYGGQPYTEYMLRHLVKASDIEAGHLTFVAPRPLLELDLPAWVWSLVHRPDGGVVGGPDYLLTLFAPNKESHNPMLKHPSTTLVHPSC
ncbi:hypothetical protein [Pseudomonas citrulli]|uniref:Uncharacterized protein n=1 Tax=Pseudomonas citrulli TaxID=3064347 RepID=A0ABT9BTP1_9PSED|nr:hypothetical protein [Pseudomonas sp. K18]MDO7895556.1 hypothetical protein [Pseudomonas sp. K18]